MSNTRLTIHSLDPWWSLCIWGDEVEGFFPLSLASLVRLLVAVFSGLKLQDPSLVPKHFDRFQFEAIPAFSAGLSWQVLRRGGVLDCLGCARG